MIRAPQPDDGDERSVLLGWLAYHRDALAAKCAGLSPDELVARAVEPSILSLAGLVRHMTEMERVYGAWALGPRVPLTCVYGEYTDGGPEWDFDVDTTMLDESFENWARERAAADTAIASCAAPDTIGEGNRRSMRWNVMKLVGEYARHNGHADLIRQRIDGAIGE